YTWTNFEELVNNLRLLAATNPEAVAAILAELSPEEAAEVDRRSREISGSNPTTPVRGFYMMQSSGTAYAVELWAAGRLLATVDFTTLANGDVVFSENGLEIRTYNLGDGAWQVNTTLNSAFVTAAQFQAG
ncbi:MAG: hypothetical protein AAF125_16215, partial [Chloroflexota bacterium]